MDEAQVLDKFDRDMEEATGAIPSRKLAWNPRAAVYLRLYSIEDSFWHHFKRER